MDKVTIKWAIFLNQFADGKGKLILPNLSFNRDFYLSILEIAYQHPFFISSIGLDKIKKYNKANDIKFILNTDKNPDDDIVPLVYKGGDITNLDNKPAYGKNILLVQKKKLLTLNGKNFIEIWDAVDKKTVNPEKFLQFFEGIDPMAAEKNFISYLEKDFYIPLCLMGYNITVMWIWKALDTISNFEDKSFFIEYMFNKRLVENPDLVDQLKSDKGFRCLKDFRIKCKLPLWNALNPSQQYFIDLDKWHGKNKVSHSPDNCRFCKPKLEDFKNMINEELRTQLINTTMEEINDLGKTKKIILYNVFKNYPSLFEGLSPNFAKFYYEEKKSRSQYFQAKKRINEIEKPVIIEPPHKQEKTSGWDLNMETEWQFPNDDDNLEIKIHYKSYLGERIKGFPAAWS